MAKDLRRFFADMEERHPDKILKIKKPLKVAYEITALQRKLDAVKKYPVIFVERPVFRS